MDPPAAWRRRQPDASWELTGSTTFHFASLTLSPRTEKISVVVEIVPPAVFGAVPMTRSGCQGRGARRVTACHSQCLRTGPRPAYLSVHPHPPPTAAAGMTRVTRVRSSRGRSHPPTHTNPTSLSSALFTLSDFIIRKPPFFWHMLIFHK